MNDLQERIEFWVPCVPPKGTHQQNVRIFRSADGKSFIGKSKTSKAARDERSLLELMRPHAPDAPMAGPVRLRVTWRYPYRKSEPQKRRIGNLPCNTRPDCDNLLKGLSDILTRLGFWTDDAQVSSVTFRKEWGSRPGIGIGISPDEPTTT